MFLQSAEQVKKVAIWVRIPRLPLELYNSQFLWRLCSGLGTMLKIDRLTSIHSRGKYARICLEIDLDKPLKSFLVIRGNKLFLEYEGLHLICFHCIRYGHKASQCAEITGKDKVLDPSISQTKETQSQLETQLIKIDSPVSIEEPELGKSSKYGAWMVAVPRKPRKAGPNQKSSRCNNGEKRNHVGTSKN